MDAALKKNVATLLELQAIEIEVASLKASLAEYPGKAAALDRELKAFEETVSQVETGLGEAKQAFRALESEAKTVQDKVVRSEEKLRDVKTNKEYQSMLKAIEDLNASLSAIEDRMLENLEAMDLQKAAIAEKHRQFEALANRIAAEKQALEEESAVGRQKLAALEASHRRIAAGVSAEMLNTYETVKRNIGSTAVAIVESAVCRGCHVNLPPQMFNELLRFDRLFICPHCERLLYPADPSES
jgi:predicted  nucleic acid-binding Zn-ribbon protein